MANTRDAVNNIYQERGDFIVIGLTGRTGSGCTETARVLAIEEFENIALQIPKDNNFKDLDERKDRVIYRYAAKNWKPFTIIEMSSIIASFIFQNRYDKFKEYIEKYNDNNAIINNKDELLNTLNGDIKSDMDEIGDELQKCMTENKSLNRNDSKLLELEVKVLKDIKRITKKLKNILRKYQVQYQQKDKEGKIIEKDCNAEVYTYFFQVFGQNIRSCGDPYNDKDKDFTGRNMFDVARRANDFIKAIRSMQRGEEATLICLDAIRNPYDATYFKDRYSAFYLVSVNTEDEERRRRLSESKLTKEQIDSLDATEYPEKISGVDQFKKQNIGACLELSDIHIYNRRRRSWENVFLTKQIIKFVMLMKHPGLITPSYIEHCMQVAYNSKLNSGCLSRQVGAAITDNQYSIKAVGWNEVPEGQVPCNLRDVKSLIVEQDKSSHSKYEVENEDFTKKIKEIYDPEKFDKLYENLHGRICSYCFKDVYNEMNDYKNQVHTRTLHAEENAFLQIVKNGGVGIKGGYLFTTASPCELCSKKAYQLGIKKIYYIDPYPGISIEHILTFGEDNPRNPDLHLFYGAIGKAYTALYSQRLSIKDELKMLIEHSDS